LKTYVLHTEAGKEQYLADLLMNTVVNFYPEIAHRIYVPYRARLVKSSGNNTPFGVCSKSSHSMLSDNPHSGFYEAETSRTLDQGGGNPTCNQGGICIVAPVSDVAETFDVRFTSEGSKVTRGHVYQTDTARTLGTDKPDPAGNQGGVAVVEKNPAYLPYSKTIYSMKEISVDAERIKRFRKRQKLCNDFAAFVAGEKKLSAVSTASTELDYLSGTSGRSSKESTV